MTIVAEYDWESDTFTQHPQEHAARQAWRMAVSEVAAKAKEKLPKECHGRIESAVKLGLQALLAVFLTL